MFIAAVSLVSITSIQKTFAKDEKDKTTIERPSASGVSNVDAYMEKAFETYDESLKITHDINFIKVEIKEIAPGKDGATTEAKITNGDGKELNKTDALIQLGSLLTRAMKQNENIKALIELQKSASEGVKSAPMMKKPKATKEYGAAADAQAFTVAETKKQIDLINQQISTLKAIKNN